MRNWNNEVRKFGIEKIARRLIDLGETLGRDLDVRGSYEKTLGELMTAVAEDSFIVKAARVYVQALLLNQPDAEADLRRLMGEIGRAGRAPYESGKDDTTEDDWVAPLRAELIKRNGR